MQYTMFHSHQIRSMAQKAANGGKPSQNKQTIGRGAGNISQRNRSERKGRRDRTNYARQRADD